MGERLIAATRPAYRLDPMNRATQGWRFKTVQDLERIGGGGTGFTVLVAVFWVFLGVRVVEGLARSYAMGIPAGRQAPAWIALLLIAASGWALVAAARSGVTVRRNRVIVRNPRGTREFAASDVIGVGRRARVVDVLELRDGRTITLWGLNIWLSMNRSFADAAIAELQLRIEMAKAE